MRCSTFIALLASGVATFAAAQDAGVEAPAIDVVAVESAEESAEERQLNKRNRCNDCNNNNCKNGGCNNKNRNCNDCGDEYIKVKVPVVRTFGKYDGGCDGKLKGSCGSTVIGKAEVAPTYVGKAAAPITAYPLSVYSVTDGKKY